MFSQLGKKKRTTSAKAATRWRERTPIARTEK